MRRTTTVTVATLLGLTAPLLASAATTAPASAAGETCRGRAATIVGGRSIVGTDGPDVVVTEGATSVRTLGGDDLVCVTGTVPVYVDVATGDGDDVVDGTTAPGEDVRVTLGSGTDTFLGSGGDDYVELAYPDPGAGPDVVHGGGGTDALSLRTGPGAAAIDNVTGTFTSDGLVRATLSGLERFWLPSEPAGRDLAFVGSDRDEQVFDSAADVPSRVDIDLGGGDDAYYGEAPPAAASRLDGGAGRDLLYLVSPLADLDLDLRDGLLSVGPADDRVLGAAGFEDAELFAHRVRLDGTDGPNRLGVTACDGTLRGRGGDDVVERAYEGIFELDAVNCHESLTINGGAGDDEMTGSGGPDTIVGGKGRDRLNGRHGADRLVGGRGHDHLRGREQRDTLLGGPGRDVADGGRGSRDLCRAERERRCER